MKDYGRILAEKHLEIARNFEEDYGLEAYSTFILGKGAAANIINDRHNVIKRQNTYAVMECLYDDYNKNPQKHIDKVFYQVLADEFDNSKKQPYILEALKCLTYQINAEQQNTASFEIDYLTLLNKAKQNILRNYDEYFTNNAMKEELQYSSECIENLTGYKIL